MLSGKSTGLLLVGILCLIPVLPVRGKGYSLTVDGNVIQGDVPHFWSRCVGTGVAHLCMRDDWRNAARIGVEEAGFKAFRGHGILNTPNMFRWDGSGDPVYNWAPFDSIYDFLVDSLGTTPLVELSFMPTDLQSQAGNVRSTPKSYAVWGELIHQLVAHCIERYGRERVRNWRWEVWNEYDFVGFWIGTEADYYQLYKYAAEGAKKADSLIKIGGPAATNLLQDKGLKFLNFCKSNNVPVDMLINHTYSDAGLIGNVAPSVDPLIFRDDNRTRVTLIKNFGKDLISINSEYSSSYAGAGGKEGANTFSMDSHVNAPFVAKSIKMILDDHSAGTYRAPEAFSYWTISDIFDEGDYIENNGYIPFAQVFGMINYQGIPKATFYAYKMLHMMGSERLSLIGGTGEADGVDGFATINDDSSEVAVLIYNFYKMFGGQTAVDTVSLTINSLPLPQGGKVESYHYRVDSTHSNVYTVWQQQNKPSKPTESQWAEMRAASKLEEFRPMAEITFDGGPYKESFPLPRQSVSLLLFKGHKPTAVPSRNFSRHMDVAIRGEYIVGGGKGAIFSIFSLDGKRIVSSAVPGGRTVAIRKCTSRRGVFLVRVVVEGRMLTSKLVRLD